MSSTNRSKSRSTHISDYYVTPQTEIIKFINEFKKYEPEAFNGVILDCCAGGDIKHPMSYPEALVHSGINGENIFTLDIRNDSLAEIKGDFLKQPPGDFDMIITNPPFNIALDIIKKALHDVKENCWVVMLLRLNFLEGKLRKKFWDTQLPEYIFVHASRMSFTDDGKTDSVAYAHYCFKKGIHPEFSKIKII